MPIKVLHCIHSLSAGGAERQLNILVNHGKEASLNFGVFFIDGSNNTINSEECELFELSNKAKYPWFLFEEICDVIDRFKPDIVHCWLPQTLILPGFLAAKRYGLPTVASFRSTKIFSGWKDVIEFFADYFFADAIVSNAPIYSSNKCYQHLFNKKVHTIIPNAVDIPKSIREKKVARHIDEPFRLLFVGRLIDVKNWQILLEALAMLKTRYPWQLMICGAGEEDKVSSRIHELGLTESIRMLGFRSDVYSIMGASDLLVLPSWKEGMPNVVLEAMKIGLPCVISEIPAHTSLLDGEDFAILFDPSDPSELAEILESFISRQKDLEMLSEKGKKFSKKYSPIVLAKKYAHFYNELLLPK